MASKRALELSDGKRCLAENIDTEKFTTMALHEISQGKVEIKGASGEAPPQKEASGESEEDQEEE
jgi:DNA-directed RNA polymerase subunit K/omega